jgi:RNA polymerase sigma-70 factor, ECF subfamily
MHQPPCNDALTDRQLRELNASVRRYLRGQLHDVERAQDLCQEVMLRVARSYSSFDGRSTLTTWAIAIARRVIVDHFRREPSNAMVCPPPDDAIVGMAPSAEAELLAAEMASCIQSEIDGLPPTYREMLLLHDLQDLSASEAAVLAECSVSTAKIRIHRGRAKLREAMETHCRLYHDSDGALKCEKV